MKESKVAVVTYVYIQLRVSVCMFVCVHVRRGGEINNGKTVRSKLSLFVSRCQSWCSAPGIVVVRSVALHILTKIDIVYGDEDTWPC